MLRINGLFGWIEANDRRSLMMFVGFVLSIHVAAAMALYVPLAAFDISHAPVSRLDRLPGALRPPCDGGGRGGVRPADALAHRLRP